MKKKLVKLAEKLPILSKVIVDFRNSKKFKTEIELLNKKSKVKSNIPSILHFSINKAATQHVKKVLCKIANENGVLPVSIHDYAFNSKLPYLDSLSFDQMEKYKHVFKETGYLYSVFGGMIENIDNVNNYRVILSIRDPRDILVSNYYSTAYSHTVPSNSSDKREGFLIKREWAQKISIDEFVLKEADGVYEILEKYRSDLCKKYNVGIVKYENMVSDYEDWILDLTEKTGLKMSSSLKEELLKENQFKKPKNENVLSHNRKGISGDYLTKLKAETIEVLNNKFEPILKFYGYIN